MPMPSRNPDHDYDDPGNEATFLKAYEDMTDYDAHPRCRYCTELRSPLAMHGTAWGWESIHADACPVNVDNQEPAVLRVTDNYGGPEHLAAEEIWQASQDEDRS